MAATHTWGVQEAPVGLAVLEALAASVVRYLEFEIPCIRKICVLPLSPRAIIWGPLIPLTHLSVLS